MALDTRLDTALNMASLSMTSLQRCTTIVLSRCKSTYGADPRSCCTTFHASQSPSLRPAATSTLFASMDISTGGRGAPNESWKESRSSCGWTRSMPLGKMLHRYLTPEGMPPPPSPCQTAPVQGHPGWFQRWQERGRVAPLGNYRSRMGHDAPWRDEVHGVETPGQAAACAQSKITPGIG